MANDAVGKPTQIPNENSTLSNAADQQKVPPLRIVLNSAGNQKSSSTSATNPTTTTNTPVGAQQVTTKKEKVQDAKTESTVKVGGRVRIKLGTNKQQPSGKNNGSKSSDTSTKRTTSSNTSANDKVIENVNEDSASSFGHLRRITRRSQRAVQPISNEDEESISSMTSTDENLNTNNSQQNSDNVNTQDSEQSNPATLTSSSASAAAGTSATNGSANTETPRRYKRRKVETSESQSIDCDNLLGSQNYRLPNQNSFELFKNIRKQVDKRLKNLNNVAPRKPYGFRDYMLTRGAYLLDGNKLGNGTNLFMNEDGGLNTVPMGKYRVLRHNRTNYSVPNRAKVPPGLPVSSPLHDLFVEQEKERYRMRMQHIKEREKLTLAAEQEIMRVYTQAALAAAEQTEPFSACTMLKHQEIYNYMDSNGVTILSREDAQQDQAQPDGVRTRRRQHGHISPSPPTRKTSDVDETNQPEPAKKGSENSSTQADGKKKDTDTQQSVSEKTEGFEKEVISSEGAQNATSTSSSKTDNSKESQSHRDTSGICPITPPDTSSRVKDGEEEKADVKKEADATDTEEKETTDKPDIKTEPVSPTRVPNTDESRPKSPHSSNQASKSEAINQGTSGAPNETVKVEAVAEGNKAEGQVVMEVEEASGLHAEPSGGSSLSNEDKMNHNKEIFLTQLQEVDDKWEKIRHDMLVRHKNEAESLHAIQKLEWEWKTKEIGACDVRTTPVIDNTLVPKLNIYSQDY